MRNFIFVCVVLLCGLLYGCDTNSCQTHSDCEDVEICAAQQCRLPVYPALQPYATQLATYEVTGTNKLINGRQITPAGDSVVVASGPIRVALTADEKYAVVNESLWCKENKGNDRCKITVVDTSTMQRVAVAGPPAGYLWHGMALSETDVTTVLATDGVGRSLHRFVLDAAGAITYDTSWKVDDCYTQNVVASADGHTAWISCMQSDIAVLDGRVAKVDLQTGSVKVEDDLKGAFGLSLAEDRNLIFAGSMADEMHAEAGDSVYALDSTTMELRATIPTCLGAEELEYDGSRYLYVACNRSDEIAVIDTQTLQLAEVILLHDDSLAMRGMHPLGLKYVASQNRLYVALSHENAVGVVDLQTKTLVGMIPTAWYPMTLAYAADRKELFVLAERGVGDGPSSTTDRKLVTLQADGSSKKKTPFSDGPNRHSFGLLSRVPLPDAAGLVAHSLQVEENNNIQERYFDFAQGNDTPIPSPDAATAASAAIKHVFFILQENFSFDMIFGDFAGAQGNPDYVIWTEEDAPNQYKLAREFTLFDNYYCESDSSLDGHQWMAAGIETDFMEKHSWNAMNYEFGTIAVSLTPGTKPHSDFIMPHLLAQGISVLAAGGIENFGVDAYGEYSDYVLSDFFAFTEPEHTDKSKAEIYLEDFERQLAANDVPQFTWIFMGNNHAFGLKDGEPAPEYWIRENDEAIGQIVGAISESPIWEDSLIFITQDDAQSGIDSVDNHRCPTLAIGPYVKRGYVSHAVYGINNIHKTIERALGSRPMHLLDTRATAMYDIFTARPVTTAFEPVWRDIQPEPYIYKGGKAPLVAMSAAMDWSEIDRNPNAGEFFWLYAKGTPPPAKNALYKHRTPAESEDAEEDDALQKQLYQAWRNAGMPGNLSQTEIQALVDALQAGDD